MPNITISLSTGAIARVTAAGQAAGYSDGPSYIKALLRAAILSYERGNAAAIAANVSDSAVEMDFVST
jgi:hypothetical protein